MLTALAAALAARELAAVDPVSLIGTFLAIAAAAALVVTFYLSSRSRNVATQQGLAIDALESRLNVVEQENADLKARAEEREHFVQQLKEQVRVLSNVVTSKQAIEDLSDQIQSNHTELMAAVRGHAGEAA
jgi:flagellar motility protein MotE (MotC chaperone)